MLGVCDKIVPGLLIGALSFGHLPTVFVPAGPMTSGLPNGEKARVRQLYAEGKVGREELLEAESASYHSKGTCTFYGTANSNQMLMEVMGLHLPDATFVNPGTPLRAALTAPPASAPSAITAAGGEPTPVGHLVDEKAIVNACVALLATGGLDQPHDAPGRDGRRPPGITLTWDDLSDLSAAVPLLTRIYPNGSADINHFVGRRRYAVPRAHAAQARLPPRRRAAPSRAAACGATPARPGSTARATGPGSCGRRARSAPSTPRCCARADDPFAPDGGLRMLSGRLGRAVVKTSAVKPEHRVVTAPAMVFDDQADFLAAFAEGRLDGRDLVAVVRYQGPAANGMPELHKLMPALGRAAGPRPAGRDRHRRPDVGRLRQGRRPPSTSPRRPPSAARSPGCATATWSPSTPRPACSRSTLPDADLDRREATGRAPHDVEWAGTGRELFSGFRAIVGTAETGASVIRPLPAPTEEAPVAQHV